MKFTNILTLIVVFITILSCSFENNENTKQDENSLDENSLIELDNTNKQMGTAITFKGKTIHTVGQLPEVGMEARDFTLVSGDLSEKTLSDYKGKNIVLNIFPSLDTKVCAMSVRKFNEEASSLENTVVLCISKDLPFAMSRFCEVEEIQNVETLSDFRTDFGKIYGVEMVEGSLRGLLSRAVVVLSPEGKVIYAEQVLEIAQEPDYEKALSTIDLKVKDVDY